MVTELANSTTNVGTVKDHIQQQTAIHKVDLTKSKIKTPQIEHCKHQLPTQAQAALATHTPCQRQETHHKITTPVKVEVLREMLLGYQHKAYLIDGFENGFQLGFVGPRNNLSFPNLKSCRDHPAIVKEKIEAELETNRVKGPFLVPPFHE